MHDWRPPILHPGVPAIRRETRPSAIDHDSFCSTNLQTADNRTISPQHVVKRDIIRLIGFLSP